MQKSSETVRPVIIWVAAFLSTGCGAFSKLPASMLGYKKTSSSPITRSECQKIGDILLAFRPSNSLSMSELLEALDRLKDDGSNRDCRCRLLEELNTVWWKLERSRDSDDEDATNRLLELFQISATCRQIEKWPLVHFVVEESFPTSQSIARTRFFEGGNVRYWIRLECEQTNRGGTYTILDHIRGSNNIYIPWPSECHRDASFEYKALVNSCYCESVYTERERVVNPRDTGGKSLFRAYVKCDLDDKNSPICAGIPSNSSKK